MKDMATLRDYIAYCRTYLHPSLSEEAGQALVQAYVGMCRDICFVLHDVTFSTKCYQICARLAVVMEQ